MRPTRGGMLRRVPGAIAACLRDRAGAAAIEFGFVAPVLVLTMLGVMQYCWILYLDNAMQRAASDTAHYAMIHTAATDDQLVAYAKQAAGPVDTAGMTVTVTRETTASADFVTVLASYREPIGVPFLPLDTVTLVGRARVPQNS